MDITLIRAELEVELTWRKSEIVFLRNQLGNFSEEKDQTRYRRSLVLMLYAHYEGFCKVALQQYVKCVNNAAVPCKDAAAAVVAASWELVFRRLANPEQKCDVFRSQLPDDTDLHRFARRRHFVEQLDDFAGRSAGIPDEAVDTESNLSPTVLRKNLFKLGMPHEAVRKFEGDIGHLLKRRHGIAHGADREGLDAREYDAVEAAAFRVMDEVMDLIMDSIQHEKYRRSSPAGGVSP